MDLGFLSIFIFTHCPNSNTARIQISLLTRNLSSLVNLAERNDPHLKVWNSFPVALRKDLNSLWRFIGPVSSLPNGSFLKRDGANIKLSPTAQWLRLHLELKWGLIEVLWRMYCVKGIK